MRDPVACCDKCGVQLPSSVLSRKQSRRSDSSMKDSFGCEPSSSAIPVQEEDDPFDYGTPPTTSIAVEGTDDEYIVPDR